MQKNSKRAARATRRVLTRPKLKQITGEQQFEQAAGPVLDSFFVLSLLWIQREEAA